MNRRLPPSRRRAGFTLIELLVAIAILGILGTVVIKSVWNNIDETRQVTTKSKAEQINTIVQGYRRKHVELPRSLEDLLQSDPLNNNMPWVESEDDLKDAWGRMFELRPGDRAGQFEVVSFGQNGQEDGFGPEYGFDRDISSHRALNSTETK